MGDRQRILRAEDMASTSTAVTTVPPQLQEVNRKTTLSDINFI